MKYNLYDLFTHYWNLNQIFNKNILIFEKKSSKNKDICSNL